MKIMLLLIIAITFLTLLCVLAGKAPKENTHTERLVNVFSKAFLSAVSVCLVIVIYNEGMTQEIIKLLIESNTCLAE